MAKLTDAPTTSLEFQHRGDHLTSSYQRFSLNVSEQVAADFAEFFSTNVLTSDKLWKSMIDGSRAETFRELVASRVVPFLSRASAVAGANLDPLMVKSLAARATDKLRDHVFVLHDYTDKTLALKETMTVQMQKVCHLLFLLSGVGRGEGTNRLVGAKMLPVMHVRGGGLLVRSSPLFLRHNPLERRGRIYYRTRCTSYGECASFTWFRSFRSYRNVWRLHVVACSCRG